MLECFSTNDDTDESMLVNCRECGSSSAIQSRQAISKDVVHLYCSCKNPHCGHSFVQNSSFLKTLSPSAKATKGMMLDLFSEMPSHEKAEFLHMAASR